MASRVTMSDSRGSIPRNGKQLKKKNFYIVDKEHNIDTGMKPAFFGEDGKYVKVPEVSCTIYCS